MLKRHELIHRSSSVHVRTQGASLSLSLSLSRACCSCVWAFRLEVPEARKASAEATKGRMSRCFPSRVACAQGDRLSPCTEASATCDNIATDLRVSVVTLADLHTKQAGPLSEFE